MIPKTIHYCWFGSNPKSKLMQKCMKSWRKYCSDYQIIEWNEDNIDLSIMPQYVQDAYAAKKWAFVTDYVRLWIIYYYGGLYLDTDVEILRPLDNLLKHQGFFAFESNDYRTVATGLGFGGEKGLPILADLMKSYDDLEFSIPDDKKFFMPNTWINWPVFETHGVVRDDTLQVIDGDVVIYPGEYFDPMEGYLRQKFNITSNTYSIHHYTMSWDENHEKKLKQARKYNRMVAIKQLLRRLIGNKTYERIKNILWNNKRKP